ncbi:MAG: hypothetical protein MK102_07990 [Fuerstiella sp.]|nr:hypothetical protein [Fuerstiella sp.]
MHQFLLIIQSAVAAGLASPNVPTASLEDMSSKWTAAVVEQSQAFDAAMEYRKHQRVETERLHKLGRASRQELQHTVELATQAAEWSELLRLQRTQFNNPPHSPGDGITKLVLLVPEVPLAFRNDVCASVVIPSNHRAMSIVQKIETLTARRKPFSRTTAHDQNPTEQQVCQEQTNVAATAQLFKHETITDLSHKITPDPHRLDRMLMIPLQFEYAHRINEGIEQPEVHTMLLSETTRRWVVGSRRLRITQAERTVTRLQNFRQLVMESHKDDSTYNEGQAIDLEVKQVRRLIRGLQREIYIANGLNCSDSEQTGSVSRVHRMGLLMRIAKESYDATRRQLEFAHYQVTRHRQMLVNLSAGDPQFTGQHLISRDEMMLATATQKRLTAELKRRKALVCYAMALYRYESGRAPDTSRVNSRRSVLFKLAIDRQPELDLIAAKINVTERHLKSLERLHNEGYATGDEVEFAAAEVDRLCDEHVRTRLRADIAILCEQLLQSADTKHAVAQR